LHNFTKMDKSQNIPEFVRGLIKGDNYSFCTLFRLFGPKIYHTSRKMGLTHEDAEEIVQEVFLKIWKKRKHLKPELSFNAYLLSILKSLIYKKAKRNIKKLAFEEYLSKEVETVHNAGEDSLVVEEIKHFSQELLTLLPKGQRQIVELRYFHQLSAEEIAAQLQLSKRTVEHQIYLAKKALKEKFSKGNLIPYDLIALLMIFQISTCFIMNYLNTLVGN
jgi:RNA polymerase sigma factor (sigma-70 family)